MTKPAKDELSGTIKRQVEFRSTEDLIPYASNSRTHSDAQVAQIAASIREFGWTSPILIDERGTIIAGHGRLLAATKLNEVQVPCIVIAGLTEAQRRALVISDNKLALNAGWDSELLDSEIRGLKDEGFDLNLLGFSEGELMGLLLPKEQGANNAMDEWAGMPEFDQKDQTSFRSIIVHFNSQEHVDQFAAMVDQAFSPKAKFIWFPEVKRTFEDSQYA